MTVLGCINYTFPITTFTCFIFSIHLMTVSHLISVSGLLADSGSSRHFRLSGLHKLFQTGLQPRFSERGLNKLAGLE